MADMQFQFPDLIKNDFSVKYEAGQSAAAMTNYLAECRLHNNTTAMATMAIVALFRSGMSFWHILKIAWATIATARFSVRGSSRPSRHQTPAGRKQRQPGR